MHRPTGAAPAPKKKASGQGAAPAECRCSTSAAGAPDAPTRSGRAQHAHRRRPSTPHPHPPTQKHSHRHSLTDLEQLECRLPDLPASAVDRLRLVTLLAALGQPRHQRHLGYAPGGCPSHRCATQHQADQDAGGAHGKVKFSPCPLKSSHNELKSLRSALNFGWKRARNPTASSCAEIAGSSQTAQGGSAPKSGFQTKTESQMDRSALHITLRDLTGRPVGPWAGPNEARPRHAQQPPANSFCTTHQLLHFQSRSKRPCLSRQVTG